MEHEIEKRNDERGSSGESSLSLVDSVAMKSGVVSGGEDLVLETKIDVVKKSSDEEVCEVEREMQDHREPEKQSCVIDVECSTSGDGSSEALNCFGENTLCRICHLSAESADSRSECSDLIQIGCGCKSDLGTAHRNCAEAWFQRKGDRCCEICGEEAKNIKGIEDTKFMDEWNEGRLGESSNSAVSDGRGGFWQGQSFCNFLMACLIISFILPWLFRANLFP